MTWSRLITCTLVSIVAGCLTSALSLRFLLVQMTEIIAWMHGLQGRDADYYRTWSYALVVTLLLALPSVLVAILTFVIMIPVSRSDRETRCRKCRYILRGLTDPCCPECGEPI